MAEQKQRAAFLERKKITVNPDGKLNKRQDDFCLYYVELGNGVEAYRAAYDSKAGAGSLYARVSALLAMPKVQRRVQELRVRLSEIALIKPSQVLQEIRNIALFDPRGICGDEGTITDLAKMPAHIASAIASIEVEEVFEQDGPKKKFVGYTKKVKFWNKIEALDKAMKHLGMFEADNKQRGLLDSLPYEQVKLIEEKLSAIVRRNLGMAGESGTDEPNGTTH